MSVDNVWTITQENLLIMGFRAGMKVDALANALDKTPGSVRWKLRSLGLASLPDAPPDCERPQVDKRRIRVRKSDLAFKRAMLAAIKSGREKAFIGVIKSKPTARYIPRPRGEGEVCGGQSVAASVAEWGEPR